MGSEFINHAAWDAVESTTLKAWFGWRRYRWGRMLTMKTSSDDIFHSDKNSPEKPHRQLETSSSSKSGALGSVIETSQPSWTPLVGRRAALCGCV